MFLLGTHALDIMCVFHQLLVVFQGNALAFFASFWFERACFGQVFTVQHDSIYIT